MIAAANLAADPCVVASGRSLTHLGVRSLPPSARLANFGASRFDDASARLARDGAPDRS